jgi:hypothetical protein
MLNICNHSLEFIIVAICKAFSFNSPIYAAKFIAGGINSQYS